MGNTGISCVKIRVIAIDIHWLVRWFQIYRKLCIRWKEIFSKEPSIIFGYIESTDLRFTLRHEKETIRSPVWISVFKNHTCFPLISSYLFTKDFVVGDFFITLLTMKGMDRVREFLTFFIYCLFMRGFLAIWENTTVTRNFVETRKDSANLR